MGSLLCMVTLAWASLLLSSTTAQLNSCQSATGLKYLHGDALTGTASCLGPDNLPYPTAAIDRMFRSDRRARSSQLANPLETQQTLLKYYEAANYGLESTHRQDRSIPLSAINTVPTSSTNPQERSCYGAGPGSRLCKTRYNTTAPLYGISLTSGQSVTIVQKFPDLLQQVIFEVCDSSECDVVQGECVQTYVPYLFLVIPLGPVTLTGQDYVLVENGCVCRPKYARSALQESSLSEVLPGFSSGP